MWGQAVLGCPPCAARPVAALLLLGRTARRIRIRVPAVRRCRILRCRRPAPKRRRTSKAIIRAKAAVAAGLPVAAILTIQVRRALPESLQLGLVRRHDQASLILPWIVNKYPILVFLFVIELADRRIFAGGGDPYDRSADNLARAKLIAARAVPRRCGIRFCSIRRRLRSRLRRIRTWLCRARRRGILTERRAGGSAKSAVSAECGRLPESSRTSRPTIDSSGRPHRVRARNVPAPDSAERQLNFAKVQQLEVRALRVLAVHRVFISFAQVPQVVGVLEILNLCRITPEFLVVGADRPRILHSAMNQFLLAVPLDVECNRRHNHCREDDHQRHDQKQRHHDVAALGSRETFPSNL